ncbi:ABC transporter substrate-binding protein [Bradyrhizobium japonicum]|uniref:ABC transporter substrate-binding protein n=2 Tax=Nitrobacteraceae TaxID=41294 RepID=UPI00040252AF|nr:MULTISPECIES: ABC transporter substrate-binding protein [Bradyrhizobium]
MLGPSNRLAEYAPEPNLETKKKDVVWFAIDDNRPLTCFAVLSSRAIVTQNRSLRSTRSSRSRARGDRRRCHYRSPQSQRPAQPSCPRSRPARGKCLAKAGKEFGVSAKQQMIGLLTLLPDVHGLGLDASQGLLVSESFYWDMNDETRAWSKRFFERNKVMPHMVPAGVYGSVLHYMKAIKAAGTTDSAAVMKAMKSLPINDFMTKNGRIREDGRVLRDFYVFRVKDPKASKGPWDYYEQVATIPAEDAARPLSESECPLLKK